MKLYKILRCVLVPIALLAGVSLCGCAENTQRIPFKEAESMYTIAYAYEDHGMTQIDITEDVPWYDDLEKLCKRINGLSEKKMIPATDLDWEKNDDKLYIESDEIVHNVVLSIRLPDSDPSDDVREYNTTTIAIRTLTDNRCFLGRTDTWFALQEQADGTADTDQNNTDEAWVYEDEVAWEMIAELDAAMRETAAEMAEVEKQETE